MSPLRALPPLLLLLLAALAAGQVQVPGHCPRPPIVQKFKLQRYLGHWFYYARYFTLFQQDLKCSRAEYSDVGDGRIGVINRAARISNGKTTAGRGQAVPAGRLGEASFRVGFERVPNSDDRANYNVIDTDYKRYAIVWSCSVQNKWVAKRKQLTNTQFLFILTRNRFPGRKLVRRIMRRLRKFGLNTDKLKKTDQKNCPKIRKPWFKKPRNGAILKLCSFKH